MWVRYDGEEFETEEDALNDACEFIEESYLISEMEREVPYRVIVEKILKAKSLEGLVEEILDNLADVRSRSFSDFYYNNEEEDDEDEEV